MYKRVKRGLFSNKTKSQNNLQRDFKKTKTKTPSKTKIQKVHRGAACYAPT